MKKQYVKRALLYVVMFLWVSNLIAQVPDTLWTKKYEGKHIRAVQQIIGGGYIFVGSHLVRTNSWGEITYSRELITNPIDAYGWGSDVHQTCDSGYIIIETKVWWDEFGTELRWIILEKTYKNGPLKWRKTLMFGVYDEVGGSSVQQTFDGGYIVAGWDWGANARCLIKTDSAGNILWNKGYGSGQFYSVQQTSDSGYIVAGDTYSLGITLIKTDSLGDVLWTKSYGGKYGKEVQCTTDDGYIITGEIGTYPNYDVFLIKTDSSGNALWTKNYGGAQRDGGFSVQQTADDGFIIAGYTGSFGGGNKDFYLLKTDSCGDTLWTETYGSYLEEVGRSVQQTSDGGYIIGGTIGYFDDGYLVKTKPDSASIEENQIAISKIQKPFLEVFPNPFTADVYIKCSGIRKKQKLSLKIYDMSGRLVKDLLPGTLHPSPTISVSWDGRDVAGNKVPSGIYSLKFKAWEFRTSRKLLLLK